MDKQLLVRQIKEQLQNSARIALNAGEDLAKEARFGATPSEKTQDARVAIENGRMAKAHVRRAREAQAALAALDKFKPADLRRKSRIDVGAIVEVEDEENDEGRTLFLSPVGAGFTLTGPGGDGHLSVVTPMSPMGKAILGRRVGDVIDLTIKRELREWTITYVG